LQCHRQTAKQCYADRDAIEQKQRNDGVAQCVVDQSGATEQLQVHRVVPLDVGKVAELVVEQLPQR
jgi:hypothetical protein